LAARRGFDPLSSVRQTDCHASSITGLVMLGPVFALRASTGSLRSAPACQPKLRSSEGW